MRLHNVLVDHVWPFLRQATMFTQNFDSSSAGACCRLENPEFLSYSLFSFLLEKTDVVWKDPSLGNDRILFTKLSHLSKDVSIHKVFPTELPCAWKVIVVLVHVVISERFRLQRGAPHDIPLGRICLLKSSPA